MIAGMISRLEEFWDTNSRDLGLHDFTGLVDGRGL
jgi:hypothetical protein